MDFDFTQEQVMLRNLTREFLIRESTPRTVRTLMEDARGFNDATWQQMAEMGLMGVAIDAGYGGRGPGVGGMGLGVGEMGRPAYGRHPTWRWTTPVRRQPWCSKMYGSALTR